MRRWIRPTSGSHGRCPTPGQPLLTTDYYFIASGDDAAQYAVLEMDDGVIGYVAESSREAVRVRPQHLRSDRAGHRAGRAADPGRRAR